MNVEIRFEVDLNGAGYELERLQHPPTMELESVLLATFATTEARVHVDTGSLRASGHPTSSFADDIWEGTLSFAADPGIFELARGAMKTGGEHVYWVKGRKAPRVTHTQEHGGAGDSHFFFDPVEAPGDGDYDVTHGEGYRAYVRVIEDWLGIEV